MSTAAILLQFLFALLGFLLSFKGLFLLLLGVILFLALPVIPKATGQFRKFTNFHLWLSASLLGRAAIVVSEHGDLLLKRMTFDDLGVEKISFGNEDKEFEDPSSSLHHWLGIPFAMADEVHGVLFDPRHAALGQRKNASDERGETTIPATQYEWDQFGVHEWKRGVFEMPTKFELVTLGAVRHLIDGGERAEYPKRVEKIYEHSRAPFESGTSPTRFILILAALLGPFAMMWLLATQGGGGGGGGGSTVGYGGTLLLLPSLRNRVTSVAKRVSGALKPSADRDSGGDREPIDWKRLGVTLGVLLPLPTIFLLVFVFVSPITAILAFIVLGMGFWMLPILSILTRPSKRLSGGFSRMLLKLGLLGYEKPVLEWTPAKYQLREFSELDDTGDVKWYGLQGSLIGFTYSPTPDSWGPEVMEEDEIKAGQEMVADGGSPQESNIPANYTRMPSMKRASSYAAFVPQTLKSDKYYLNTGIATGRFSDSAVGEKALSRLLWAKEEYGGGSGLSDKAIIYAMVGCGVLSTALGVFVFFL